MSVSVVIVDYNPAWPQMYAEERALIVSAMGPWLLDIEHGGSTSVPGLAAKPIIDIIVGVRRLDDAMECVKSLAAVGYEYKPDDDLIAERRYFNKGPQERHRHLHVVELGGDFWRRHLAFRDYLRTHPDTAQQYAALKRELAHRFADDSVAYTGAKTEFIRSVEALALAEREPWT
jgi:GrpB-like predicted nucleotidyltransferase (UPF0157 family)